MAVIASPPAGRQLAHAAEVGPRDEGVMTVLMVASVGGHLSELAALAGRIVAADEPRLWMTWRNPQSESLLAGEEVLWVPPVQPRDWRGVSRVARRVPRLMRAHTIDRVVTTGSALALAVVPYAAARGVPCHFIETATRTEAASLTGRLVGLVPSVRLYTQYPAWAGRRWAYRGSIFDGYESVPVGAPAEVRRIVVTLGTMSEYPFRRLVDRLIRLFPREAQVLWQTGCTPLDGLGIDGRELVPAEEMHAAIGAADVVVGHCGCGTALAALDAGKHPVLVPRLGAYGEHVDDHQQALADELARLDLAVTAAPEQLTMDHLRLAAGRRIDRLQVPGAFDLDEGPTRLRARSVLASPRVVGAARRIQPGAWRRGA